MTRLGRFAVVSVVDGVVLVVHGTHHGGVLVVVAVHVVAVVAEILLGLLC